MSLLTSNRFAVCLAALLVSFSCVGAAGTNGINLRVMTFNLRYASSNPPNAWPVRRPVMRNLILKVAPDLIGTQEGLLGQLNDLAADLPAYRWIGTGRDGENRGEFMAIFYRPERFEPMATNHFWLSDTPEIPGSTTWSNSNRRMVTGVRFRDRVSGREFHFWDTHFDHQVELARQKSAGLVRERISRLEKDIPFILVGDFNAAAANSRAYEILVNEAGLTDAWLFATRRVNEKLNTFHNYQPPRELGVRIDWILPRNPARVTQAEIVNYSENGQFPSDHFPVVAEVSF